MHNVQLTDRNKGSLNIQQPYFLSGQTKYDLKRCEEHLKNLAEKVSRGLDKFDSDNDRGNVEFDLEQRFVTRCSKQFLGLLSLIGLYLHHCLHRGTDRVWCMCGGAILN